MAFLIWVIVGGAAGFIAHKIARNSGERFGLDIFLGIAGAVMGGWIVNYFGAAGPTGLNIYSIAVPVACAGVLLFLFHTVIHRGRTLTA